MQEKLQRLVTDIRRSVTTRPNESINMRWQSMAVPAK
jgi:hypothetical protein